MRSWITPMISSSLIGRPSMSAVSTASTTSPRGGSFRRCATNASIHAYISAHASRTFGLVGDDAAVAMSLRRETSSVGASSARSKNASPGNGRAKSAMNSQDPASMNPSMSRVTIARVGASYGSTAAAVKWALMSRLKMRCSGGSTCSGIARTTMVDSVTPTPRAELNVSQSCATRRTSS